MSDTTVVDYLALKKENAALNLEEIRLGSAELHSMPRYVMVELTQGCNLKCSMCRSRSIRYAEKEMDREIFRRTADLLFPAAEMVDVRGWGKACSRRTSRKSWNRSSVTRRAAASSPTSR